MVRYFTDYETENSGVIPFIRSQQNRMDRKSSIRMNGREKSSLMVMTVKILPALNAHGDFPTWLETVKALRKSAVSRAMLAGSFVS